MDARLFWKSLVVQALVVGAVFGILIALPLPGDFFEDYGRYIGPVAWIGCSLATARLIDVPAGIVLFSALAGGVAGVLIFLVAGHTPALVVALLVFAASTGGYDPDAELGDEASAPERSRGA